MKKLKQIILLMMISIMTIGLVGCGYNIDEIKDELSFNDLLNNLESGNITRREAINEVNTYINKSQDLSDEEKKEVESLLFEEMDKNLTLEKLKKQINFDEDIEKKASEGKSFEILDKSIFNTDLSKSLEIELDEEVSLYNETIENIESFYDYTDWSSFFSPQTSDSNWGIERIDKETIAEVSIYAKPYIEKRKEDYKEFIKGRCDRFIKSKEKLTYKSEINSIIDDLNLIVKVAHKFGSPYSDKDIEEIVLLEKQMNELLGVVNSNIAKQEEKRKEEAKQEGVYIGMKKQQVLDSMWGKPQKINRTENKYGVSEQWVYGNGNYLYFDDGILTAIQN